MRLVYIYAYMSSEEQPQFQFQFRKSQKKKEGKLTSRFRPNENFKGTETTSEKFNFISRFAVPCFAGIICRVHLRINNIGREGRQDSRRYQICLFVFEEIFSRIRNICPISLL